jgi:hypothetical protein
MERDVSSLYLLKDFQDFSVQARVAGAKAVHFMVKIKV